MAEPGPAATLRAGGCHCGRVRYAVTAEPLGTVVCRCASCRLATGALRVPWTTVPRVAFEWTSGTPRERESSPGVLRTHCADCGTTLTWRRTDRGTEIDVTTVSFDEISGLAPTDEIWGDDDPPWTANLDQGLPRYARRASDARLLPAPDGVELHHVAWSSHSHALLTVRLAVFVDEQGVPREIEADDRDGVCAHVFATASGQPIATGRLDVAQRKIGRVAVLASWRGHGVGAAVMLQLHRIARSRGLGDVWCHAQLSATPFYERIGYRPEGDEFVEAGIPHRTMRAQLAHHAA